MKRIDNTESRSKFDLNCKSRLGLPTQQRKASYALNATRYKKKNAQQLIEFLLVVPFMVIILGILTEYAYALNINMTLSQGLKTVTSPSYCTKDSSGIDKCYGIYSQLSPTIAGNNIRNLVTAGLKQYLKDNNVPTDAKNNIQVSYIIKGQTAVFVAGYKYIPAFTLPKVYFKFLPDEFNFLATAAVPVALFGANNYDKTLTSAELDKIWGASNFTDLASFNGTKNGIMKDDSSGGRNHMIFLIPTMQKNLTNPYLLVGWDGVIKTDSLNYYYTVDTENEYGKLYACPAEYNSICTDPDIKFFDYLTCKGIYNIIFIHDTQTPTPTTPIPLSQASLTNQWLRPPNQTDLSATSVDGILKRALALSDMAALSSGDYDNIDVSAYNKSISTNKSYTVKYFGSMVFVTNGDDISKIINGASVQNINGSDWK